MATVLIEVGSTGQGETTTPSSPRSRRVTLAHDEAKLASHAMSLRKLSSSTPRKASLPDPEDSAHSLGLGPPRGSPEQWRASTGRQDLSKRQLEVLRTMLRTPVSGGHRPMMGSRQPSTLSMTSSASQSNEGTPISGIRFPSPPASTYIVPSGSFPTPGTADGLAKGRSKAGLAGLKDFLKSLKGTPTPTKAQRGPRPPRLPRNPHPTPSSPTTSAFEEIFYPTNRTTFSALGPTSIQSHSKQSAPLRRIPSPEKNGSQRPSLRNIFRSSSGNWSDLVRGNTTPPPPLPTSITSNAIQQVTVKSDKAGLPITTRKRDSNQNTAFIMPEKSVKSPPPRPPPLKLHSAGQENMSLVAEGEGTVRPARKSRILGLGTPISPISPVPTVRWEGGQQYPYTNETSGHRSRWSLSYTGGIQESPSQSSTCTKMDEDELVVALTPENLPVLLDYLKQCEGKLREWASEIEALNTKTGDR
jgi:hypothetical protein